ncbi:MAG: matrixin family metalloprotease [Verrucomicrobia bacterium]|nr:matrixin family metalloprotease [Verrucomicrobiota bacterium]
MRFLAPDHGEAIPYLVDAQALPAGVTTNQATNAVASAFQAWSAVTGIRFVFEGFTNFGNASAAVTNLNGSPRDDAKIRIQLHDTFNYIPASSTVGNGGVGDSFFTGGNTPTNWGTGANVKGFEFNRAVRGFVVLEHTNVFLQNTNHLAEVLCHEIGHVLGMMHSSESDPEPNTVLSNAVMYFRAHNDNRGAVLGSYDPPVVQSAYPPTNTPPWTFDRVMDVVDASPQPNVAGVNELRLQPFDLFSPSNLPVYSLQLSNPVAPHGTFATNATNALLLRFTPTITGNGPRIDPSDELTSYDSVYARVFDGTNASPYVFIRVISLSQDNFPATSDGIPDNWMTTYFGNPDPSVGANHRATNDFDGDGFTNFQEYLLGSDPTNSRSSLRLLSQTATNLTFEARPYENYELFASTNLSNWVRLPIGVRPTNTVGAFTNLFATNNAKLFYRVGRVP